MADHGFLKQEPGYATKAIHVGQEPSQWNSRAVIPPISLATTFQQDAPAEHRVRHFCHQYRVKELLLSSTQGKYIVRGCRLISLLIFLVEKHILLTFTVLLYLCWLIISLFVVIHVAPLYFKFS